MLKILDLNDNALEVEVVRYFRLNSKNYFMYTLNETDEQNYLKLYALKVTDNLQGEKIVDDAEWAVIKDYIKVIIKGNKEGNLSIEDLNFEDLRNLKISETRAFKLSAQLVDLLKANKKEFAVVETFDVTTAMNEMTIEPIQSAFDMTLPEELPTVEAVVEPVMPDPVAAMFDAPMMPTTEAVVEPSEFTLPTQVLPTTEFEFPTVIAPTPIVETPIVEETVVELPVVEPVATETQDFAMPTEQFVADYSFEQEDIATEVATITPIVVTPIPEEEIDTNFANDYKLLYEEEKELTEVLKNEISELREKLGKITQILSQ